MLFINYFKRMPSYTNYVELMAREYQDKVFFNSGPIHAAIVMSRIFKYSKDIVRIYCGGFDGVVSNYDEYLEYLSGFLKEGGRLKILAQEDRSKGPGKIFKVLKRFPNSVQMYRTSTKVIFKDTQQPLHFTVGDDRMVRLEVGIDNYAAQVNLGNKEEASMLINIFDGIFEKTHDEIILL
jgi:hypothetical protein